MPAAPQPLVGPRLSVMMFLQFFLWGSWFVTLGPFMNALKLEGTAIGNAYSMAQIAAVISPFFLGLIADRFFPSQVVMGVLHILGGGIYLLLPKLLSTATPGDGQSTLIVGLVLGHMLCYMPTLGLSNTIAFHAMTNPEKQFPLVRVWGTIGWIVAGFTLAFVGTRLFPGSTPEAKASLAISPYFFNVAGIVGLALGLYSFTLPNTPAPLKGRKVDLESALGLKALALLKQPQYLIFAIASMLLCIPLAAYYAFAGVYVEAVGVPPADVPVKMSYGQMSEIAFMLIMPLCFARLGVKWMLAVGMLAWVVRYGLFAGAWHGPAGTHAIPLVLVGIILHGICYDFFFVTGQIYTERVAPKEIKAQAQGFLVLLTQGVGMFLGNQLFARIAVEPNTGPPPDSIRDWKTIWIYPAAFALAVLIVFIIGFRGQSSRDLEPTPAENAPKA
jgi:nucleoside transporter